MRSVSLLMYRLTIGIYDLLIKLAAFKIEKAQLIQQGRKEAWHILNSKADASKSYYWFHCASLGEFEQGRPLLEALKSLEPETPILLTFFSPSGFEVRKNYSFADVVMYLPKDSKRNAELLLDQINIKASFFIKYEFWYYYLNQLNKKNIPTYLVSGIFRSNQPFFKFYGGLHRKMLSYFSHFFVQNYFSKQLLKTIEFENATVTGDARFDRVFDIAEQKKQLPFIHQFCDGKSALVAGSTWPVDEHMILKSEVIQDFKIIIAPHEIDEPHLLEIEKITRNQSIRLSQLDDQNALNHKILIIDQFGLLSSIYQFAKIAYVGGGFGKHIHNILEASVYNIPVIIGPRFRKAQEAHDLIEVEGVYNLTSTDKFDETLQQLQVEERYQKACRATETYMNSKRGTTQQILNYLQEPK